MTQEQRIWLDMIADTSRWSFMWPTPVKDVVEPVAIAAQDFVDLRLVIGGKVALSIVIRGYALPILAGKIAECLPLVKWNSPVSIIVKTGDGVTHILKTYDDRARPAIKHGADSNDRHEPNPAG